MKDELAARWVPFASVKPWAKNPKKNDESVERITALLIRFGWGRTLLAREENGELIAGHATRRAVEALIARYPQLSETERKGWHPEAVRTALEGVVPVRFKSMSAEEAHELAVADNRSAEWSSWDDALLYEQLGGYEPDERLLLGYSDKDMAELQRSLHVPGAEEEEPPHPNEGLVLKRKVATGQLWLIPSLKVPGEHHRLLVGDSQDPVQVGRLAAGGLFEWMWTDPPYGVDYMGGDRRDSKRKGMKIKNDKGDMPAVVARVFETADAFLSAGAPFYIATADISLSTFLLEIEKLWKLSQVLCWDKGSILLGRADYQFRHELIIYGWKEGAAHPWFGGRKLGTVIEVKGPRRNEYHPTMKPTELIEKTLVNSSTAGSRGYEPFAGSGSTIIAAENLGRLCSAVEIDPLYAAAILERCSRAGMEPRLDGAGKQGSRRRVAASSPP